MDRIHALGHTFRAVPGMDREYRGAFIKKDGAVGWTGLESSRREALARAVAHGEFDVPVFRGARVATLDSWLLADSIRELDNLTDRIVGLGSDGSRFTVTKESDRRHLNGRARTLTATADDGWVRAGGVYVKGCTLQFVFADPRWYGDSQTTPLGTSHTVFHRGNFPAFSVVEIPSAPSSYTITSPAGTLTVSGVTAGGTHTVDLRNGRVRRDGVLQPVVGVGELWSVPVGTRWPHILSVPGIVRTPDTFL